MVMTGDSACEVNYTSGSVATWIEFHCFRTGSVLVATWTEFHCFRTGSAPVATGTEFHCFRTGSAPVATGIEFHCFRTGSAPVVTGTEFHRALLEHSECQALLGVLSAQDSKHCRGLSAWDKFQALEMNISSTWRSRIPSA